MSKKYIIPETMCLKVDSGVILNDSSNTPLPPSGSGGTEEAVGTDYAKGYKDFHYSAWTD